MNNNNSKLSGMYCIGYMYFNCERDSISSSPRRERLVNVIELQIFHNCMYYFAKIKTQK